MAKPTPRKLEVLSNQRVSPNMRRITLGGDELSGFPPDQASAYVKLLFNQDGTPVSEKPNPLKMINPGSRPVLRTYTVRSHDAANNQLEIDFVVHAHAGPASAWAGNAQPGDGIVIAGPGGKKLVDPNADWFFIAGDMTAFPALGVSIEALPADARGYAVLEIIDEEDKLQVSFPENLDVHWVLNPEPATPNTLLADKVMSLPWLEGKPSIWAAGEFMAVRAMRRYFKQERNVAKDEIYISSYWKMGVTEEQHKVEKKNEAD